MPNRIWFSKNNLVERPSPDYVLCGTCRNRVALVDDHIQTVQSGGIFKEVYNVEVNNHETLYDNTIANVYCVQCGTRLGWKFITVPQPDIYAKEGRFFMNLYRLSYWNDEPLLRLDEEQDLGANKENADQDGEAIDQDGDTTDQDGDANDENTDEDVDITGESEDSTDEDGDTTDEDGETSEQDLDANKENIDPNEQNADEDGDANDENTDEDGDATDEDGDTTDEDGDTSEQDLDANKENIDQDGQNADQDDDED